MMRPQSTLITTQRLGTRQHLAFGAMTTIALSLMVIGLLHLRQQSQQWEQLYAPSWSSALATASQGDKLCLVRFYTDYCYPCQAWDEALRRDGSLFELLDQRFVLYQIDAWNTYNGGRELAKRYGITTYPTLLVTDAEGKEKARFVGLEPPAALRRQLMDAAGVTAVRDANSAPSGPPVAGTAYGLRLRETVQYEEARSWASQEALGWNRGVYIQPEGKGYALILGAFETRDEAKITRRFLEVWENRPTKVISLEAAGTAYGF